MPGKPSLAPARSVAPAAPPPRAGRPSPRAAQGARPGSAKPKPGSAPRQPGREHLERCWRSPLDPARWYGMTDALFYKIALPAPLDEIVRAHV